MEALEHIYSLIDRSLEWLELEFKRYQALENHWKNLKGKVEEVILIEGTNVLKRDIKYVGNAERRFNKYEKHIKPEMLSFISEVPEVNVKAGGVHYAVINSVFDKIRGELKRINIEAAGLLVDSSLHSSKLYDSWQHIKDALKERDMHRVEAAIVEIGIVIEEGKKWIRALAADLTAIKKEDLPKVERELEFKGQVKEKLPILHGFEKVMEHFKRADDSLEDSLLRKSTEEIIEKWATPEIIEQWYAARNKGTTIETPDVGTLKLKRKADFGNFKGHLEAARKILEGTAEGCKRVRDFITNNHLWVDDKKGYEKEFLFLEKCQSTIKDVAELTIFFVEGVRIDSDSNIVFSKEGGDKLRRTSIGYVRQGGSGYDRLGSFWEQFHHSRKLATKTLEIQALYFIFGETSKMLRYTYFLSNRFEKDFL